MCLQYIKLNKRFKETSPKSIFAPCGQCEECRKAKSREWEFRLRVVAQVLCEKENWKCAFNTLTYNDDYLPIIPFECALPTYEAEQQFLDSNPTPCFDKEDIKGLLKYLKNWYGRNYKTSPMFRYMVCSEFGSHTARPHYHIIWFFPPDVDTMRFYACISDYWCGTQLETTDDKRVKKVEHVNRGFICPRYENALNGYKMEKPFVADSPAKTAKYVAKYVCKDIYFLRALPSWLDDDNREYKSRYAPFHLQSRSLGSDILYTVDSAGEKVFKDDNKLMDLLVKGYSFTGSKTSAPLCSYLRNKILYKPQYTYEKVSNNFLTNEEDWENSYRGELVKNEFGAVDYFVRHVSRTASDFLLRHHKEVFKLRQQKIKESIDKLTHEDVYISSGCTPETARQYANEVDEVIMAFGLNFLANHYVAFYRRSPLLIRDMPIEDNWLATLNDDALEYAMSCPLDLDYGYDAVTGNHYSVSEIDDAISYILDHQKYITQTEKTEQEKLVDFVADWWKSQGNNLQFN